MRHGAPNSASRRWRLVPVAGAAGALVVGLGGGAAFAFFSGGPGTGDVATGSPVTLDAVATTGPADLLPGDAGAVSFTVHNPNAFGATLCPSCPRRDGRFRQHRTLPQHGRQHRADIALHLLPCDRGECREYERETVHSRLRRAGGERTRYVSGSDLHGDLQTVRTVVVSQGRHLRKRAATPRTGGSHMRRPKHVRTDHGRTRRFRSPMFLFVCAFVFASGTAAFAYSTTSVSGTGRAQAVTLATPGAGSASNPAATSVSLSWGASSGLPPHAGYLVLRSTSSGGPYAKVGPVGRVGSRRPCCRRRPAARTRVWTPGPPITTRSRPPSTTSARSG